MSPASGSSAPPSWSALTCALAVPTLVPGAAVVVIAVPVGMTMAARAVASSPTAADATSLVTLPPAYDTDSFGDVYAAVATAASASAATAATAATAVRVRFLIVSRSSSSCGEGPGGANPLLVVVAVQVDGVDRERVRRRRAQARSGEQERVGGRVEAPRGA